jgi:hypothetical protein
MRVTSSSGGPASRRPGPAARVHAGAAPFFPHARSPSSRGRRAPPSAAQRATCWGPRRGARQHRRTTWRVTLRSGGPVSACGGMDSAASREGEGGLEGRARGGSDDREKFLVRLVRFPSPMHAQAPPPPSPVEKETDDGLVALEAGAVEGRAASRARGVEACAPVEEEADDGLVAALAGKVVEGRPPAPVRGVEVGAYAEEESHAHLVPRPREAHQPRALVRAVAEVPGRDEEVLLAVVVRREEGEAAALVREAVEGDEARGVEDAVVVELCGRTRQCGEPLSGRGVAAIAVGDEGDAGAPCAGGAGDAIDAPSLPSQRHLQRW